MFLVEAKGLSSPLYHKDQMPEHFHESFIIKGYRHPKSTLFQCFVSLFIATNETLNFWTHFIPSWYFMWILRDLAITLDFRHDSYTWPMLGYMVMCCIYPLTSAIAHVFNTMSLKARHICFFLDYSAISCVTFSVALSYKAYSFPSDLQDTYFGDLYIRIAFTASIACLILSCRSRFVTSAPLRKVVRLGSLGLPCIFSVIPVIYRLLEGTEEDMRLTSGYYHLASLVFLFMSAFLYGTHLPERLFPGSFDIVGHSHQLFHVCTILGTMNQMQAMLYDMKERKTQLTQDWQFKTADTSIGLVALVLMLNTVIVAVYSYQVHSNKLKTT